MKMTQVSCFSGLRQICLGVNSPSLSQAPDAVGPTLHITQEMKERPGDMECGVRGFSKNVTYPRAAVY